MRQLEIDISKVQAEIFSTLIKSISVFIEILSPCWDRIIHYSAKIHIIIGYQ